ncbi:uncharacterized protein ACIB01_012233 isoform 1-T1 [Guaruba guarouba]
MADRSSIPLEETMNLGKWRTPPYCSISRLSSCWFMQHFSSLRIRNRRNISLATCIPNDTMHVACQGSPLRECSQDFKKACLQKCRQLSLLQASRMDASSHSKALWQSYCDYKLKLLCPASWFRVLIKKTIAFTTT